MPLNIRVDNPEAFNGAVLDYVPSLRELIEGIPNLVGAWNPSDLSVGSKVSQWRAQYGSGTFSQPTASRQPEVVMVDGGKAVRNTALSQNLVLDQALTSGATITVGGRFKLDQTAQDFQALFGNFASSWRALYRTAGNIQFDGVNDVLAPVTNGAWHTIFVCQSADTTRLIVDGVVRTASNAPAAMTQMFIGSSAGTGTGNGFLGAEGKIIIAQSDLYGTPHMDAANIFLNL